MLKIALGVMSILALGAGSAAAQEASWAGGYFGVVAGASQSSPYGYYHGYFYPTDTGNTGGGGTTTTPGGTGGSGGTGGTAGSGATVPPTSTTPGYISYTINKRFTDANFAASLGYNMQMGRWVVGGDVDAGYIGGSGGIKVIDPGGSGRYDTLSMDFGGHARARVGYAMGGWLPYASAGAVFDDVTASHWGVSPTSPTPMLWTQSGVRVGYSLGVGVDKQMPGGWMIRGEYARDYLGRQTYQWVQDLLYSYTSVNIDTVRVGVFKRF